jgi:hypothetical protein
MNAPYQQSINQYKFEFIRKVLTKICDYKSQIDEALYISYRTDYPSVILSPTMKKKHPKEITIILQHQFEDLKVTFEGFFVTISFDSAYEKIYIPFNALTGFVDSNNGYNLQFEPKITSNILILDHFRKPNKPL